MPCFNLCPQHIRISPPASCLYLILLIHCGYASMLYMATVYLWMSHCSWVLSSSLSILGWVACLLALFLSLCLLPACLPLLAHCIPHFLHVSPPLSSWSASPASLLFYACLPLCLLSCLSPVLSRWFGMGSLHWMPLMKARSWFSSHRCHSSPHLTASVLNPRKFSQFYYKTPCHTERHGCLHSHPDYLSACLGIWRAFCSLRPQNRVRRAFMFPCCNRGLFHRNIPLLSCACAQRTAR